MAVTNDFNRVKPGHLNIGRALRSLSMKTDQSRQLTLSIPAVYEKDSYGVETCLLYTSPSPRDQRGSRKPSSA